MSAPDHPKRSAPRDLDKLRPPKNRNDRDKLRPAGSRSAPRDLDNIQPAGIRNNQRHMQRGDDPERSAAQSARRRSGTISNICSAARAAPLHVYMVFGRRNTSDEARGAGHSATHEDRTGIRKLEYRCKRSQRRRPLFFIACILSNFIYQLKQTTREQSQMINTHFIHKRCIYYL